MKRPAIYIIVGLLFFAAFSELSLAAVENRISSATIPPSRRSEGLIRSPDPIDRSGNLLVTGNVRGASYFRGVVPYRAPSYFGQTIPSSSLDSFLRDSAGSEDFGRYTTTGYRPYYSSTQTVTTTAPDSRGVVRPPIMNIGGYTAQSYLTGMLPERRDAILHPTTAISLARLRPMSMTPKEMEKLISTEMDEYSPARLTDQQYQTPAEQFKRGLGQVSEKTTEIKENLTDLDGSLLPLTVRKPDSNLPAKGWQVDTPKRKKQVGEDIAEMPFGKPWVLDLDKQLDVYDQMKQQLDSLQKNLELEMATQQAQKAAGSAAGESDETAAEEQIQRRPSSLNLGQSGLSQADKLAEADLSAVRAKTIMGPFQTFASFSEDKFNKYMRAAEIYLKQGKYYRAADAYTIATIYKPDDPLAYAGKSHALFASGEYMSSALFLSRALRIFPDYAGFKIDIVAMVGDRDKLENRVVDVEEWLSKSNAPELYFLLAYVYYQMDRPQKAKDAVNAAYEKMPEAPAVLALKKAIEDNK